MTVKLVSRVRVGEQKKSSSEKDCSMSLHNNFEPYLFFTFSNIILYTLSQSVIPSKL